MDRKDLITITLVKYKEPQYKLFRAMTTGKFPDRFAVDFGHYSIIFELWFLRGKNL